MPMPIGHDRPGGGVTPHGPRPTHDVPGDPHLPVKCRRGPAPRAVVAALALLPALAGAGCAVAANPSAPTAVAVSSDGSASFESELAFCASETNRLRATAGEAPLARSTALEAYAARAAQTDGLARTPHTYANSTNHGNGTAVAENELLYWNLSYYKSVHNVIAQGLTTMWQQGKGGIHYANMTGKYREVGCGIFVNGDDVSVVQAFR